MIEFEGVKIIEVRDSATEPTGCYQCVFQMEGGIAKFDSGQKGHGCFTIGKYCIERGTHFEEYHEF